MERILWYFADPMCSWCWGFTPIIESLVSRYRQRIPISLVVGGLRPGTTEPMGPEMKAEILHHWQQVHELTGQPFQFDNDLLDDFVYDTEPAGRAAVAMPALDPAATFPYFIRLQQAFYQQGRDITRSEVLADLAAEFAIETEDFMATWSSEDMKQKVRRNFAMARQYQVQGFPTLVLQDKHAAVVLSSGYQRLEFLEPKLLAWLEASETRHNSASN